MRAENSISEKAVTKRKPGRPSSEEELNLQELLNIATQAFSEKGFDGTSLTEIAERAGISKSMMTYHFKSKEELWKQSIRNLGGKLLEKLSETKGTFKDLSGIPLMKVYTRLFVYFCADHPEFYKMVFHEMCAKTERTRWMIEHILQPALQLGEEIIMPADMEEEKKKKIPIANLVSIAMGAANAFFIHEFQMREQYGINPYDAEQIEKHADIVNEVFYARFEEQT